MQFLTEIVALDQLHRVEELAVIFTNIVYGNNVRMIQPRYGFGFDTEAFRCSWRRESTVANHLQGDETLQAELPRSINNAHAAARDFGDDFVVTKDAATANQFLRFIRLGRKPHSMAKSLQTTRAQPGFRRAFERSATLLAVIGF
jgi:hypothetical protein